MKAKAAEMVGGLLKPLGLAFLVGLVISSARMTLMVRHDAEWYRYLIVVITMLGQTLSYWWAIQTRFYENPLRFPAAFWILCFFTMLSAKKIVVADIPYFLVFTSPLLLIATYSWVEFRKPEGGKQIELPTNWVHRYKRLGWRWMTKPHWDFWLVWLGLLVSPSIGIYCFMKGWNFGEGSALAYLLRLYALFWLVVFVFQWILAPRHRDGYKMVYWAAAHTRVLGILYLGLLTPSSHSLQDRIWNFVLTVWFTSIFEAAYDRCCRRQTQEGILEYEALEGPSIGL